MRRRIIIFLIRKRLKLNKYQRFIFKSQSKSGISYYFTEKDLIMSYPMGITTHADISLDWILNRKDGIIILQGDDNNE